MHSLYVSIHVATLLFVLPSTNYRLLGRNTTPRGRHHAFHLHHSPA